MIRHKFVASETASLNFLEALYDNYPNRRPTGVTNRFELESKEWYKFVAKHITENKISMGVADILCGDPIRFTTEEDLLWFILKWG